MIGTNRASRQGNHCARRAWTGPKTRDSSPRPAYQPIAAEIIVTNSPGVTTADLNTFEYHSRRIPLYPFEEAEYNPE